MTVLTKPIQTRNVIGLSLTSNTKGLLEQGGFAQRRGFDSCHLNLHHQYLSKIFVTYQNYPVKPSI